MTAPGRSRFFMVFGGVVLAGVILYYAFMAIDGMGLTDQQGTGTVLSKEHHEPGRTYSTQIIGNRTVVLPQTTPEAYVLRLDIHGIHAEAFVDKAIYDGVAQDDRVSVTYQRRRVTGGVQVVAVTR